VLIRPRRISDVAACAGLVREVHALDRYPRFLPEDLSLFLAPPGGYGSWVADRRGDVIGHIALLPRSVPAALELASNALGRPADKLAVVARLFVSPQARRHGAGRLLLDTATAEAASHGLWPVLDVDADLAPAIALYESRGWVRAGTITVRFKDGQSLNEYVYLGPAPTGPDGKLAQLPAPQ
jgi:GNAT superfamily N-acetyltransferase